MKRSKRYKFQTGGLWDTNKPMWSDSTMKANSKLDWVKRAYEKNTPSIQIPGEEGTSTHMMGHNGQGYVFPHVVNKNGKLSYLQSDDEAGDYASQTNTGIQMTPEQAEWFANNGYKTAPGVLNNKTMNPLKYQMGGYTPTNLTQSNFIPTYVGTPLEDAKGYGQDLLATYKSNIADLTKIDIANAQRKVLEGDTPESAKYDQELKAKFEEMAKKGDYENMTSQVNELARRHVNDKNLKSMAESRAVADKEDELIMKMRAAGQEPLFLQDRTKHKSVSYDEKGNPTYNVYKATAETPLDYQAKKADIWNVIKPSLAGMSEKQVNETMRAIDGYITTGTWKGISDNTIRDKVENALTTYKGTSEYRQERRVDMLEAEKRGLTGADAEKFVEDEQRRKMKAEGMLRVFSETHPDYNKDWMLETDMRNAGKNTNDGHLSLLNGIRANNSIPSQNIVSSLFNVTADSNPFMPKGLLSHGPSTNVSTIRESWEKGTTEQRQQYESLARNVVKELFPKGTLDQFYTDTVPTFEFDPLNTKPDTKKNPNTAAQKEMEEKKFLYGPEVKAKIDEVLKEAEKNMTFSVTNSFDSEDINKKTNEVRSSLTSRKLLVDGKVITAIENPEFFAAIADPANMKVFKETTGLNSLGKIANNDPAFYNSYVASYIDPKTGEAKELIIAKDLGEPQYVNVPQAELWSQIVSEPFKSHKIQMSPKLEVDFVNTPGLAKPYKITSINGEELADGGKDFTSYKYALKFLEELNAIQ